MKLGNCHVFGHSAVWSLTCLHSLPSLRRKSSNWKRGRGKQVEAGRTFLRCHCTRQLNWVVSRDATALGNFGYCSSSSSSSSTTTTTTTVLVVVVVVVVVLVVPHTLVGGLVFSCASEPVCTTGAVFFWGEDNNVHVTAFGDHAQNTGIHSTFALCTTYCARMWSKTSCHKHLCFWRACPKHGYLQRFCLCVHHTVHVVLSFCVKRPQQKKNIPNLQTLFCDF